jgi:hypothetical protein
MATSGTKIVSVRFGTLAVFVIDLWFAQMSAVCRSATIRQKHFGPLERLLRLSELTTSGWVGDRPEGAQNKRQTGTDLFAPLLFTI